MIIPGRYIQLTQGHYGGVRPEMIGIVSTPDGYEFPLLSILKEEVSIDEKGLPHTFLNDQWEPIELSDTVLNQLISSLEAVRSETLAFRRANKLAVKS